MDIKNAALVALAIIGVSVTVLQEARAQVRERSGKKTVMIVLTHGDDLASIAPLPVKYAAEGHTVYYAIFTGLQAAEVPGSKGREEMLCASRELPSTYLKMWCRLEDLNF